MKHKVKIHESKVVFSRSFVRILEVKLQHERYDGEMSDIYLPDVKNSTEYNYKISDKGEIDEFTLRRFFREKNTILT